MNSWLGMPICLHKREQRNHVRLVSSILSQEILFLFFFYFYSENKKKKALCVCAFIFLSFCLLMRMKNRKKKKSLSFSFSRISRRRNVYWSCTFVYLIGHEVHVLQATRPLLLLLLWLAWDEFVVRVRCLPVRLRPVSRPMSLVVVVVACWLFISILSPFEFLFFLFCCCCRELFFFCVQGPTSLVVHIFHRKNVKC